MICHDSDGVPCTGGAASQCKAPKCYGQSERGGVADFMVTRQFYGMSFIK
jgi:hypothetical protein